MTLSIGKLSGLRRLADDRGIFRITAMDQRNSLKVLVDPANPNSVTARQLTDIKIDLASTLSPHSTAILIDPQYGAPQAIAAGTLDPHIGLIVTLEGENPRKVGEGIVTTIAEGWSVGKLQKMGGDAVKLLVRYRPDLQEAAKQNLEVVQKVCEDCKRCDIPFVLEAVTYALNNQSKEDFAREKPQLVIQSAKDLSRYCDLYKAEFPGDIVPGADRAALTRQCQELNQASIQPWVLLSAGADIDRFAEALLIACQCGASGFLAGRAIWKDYVKIGNSTERRAALKQKAVHNLGMVSHIAQRDALPWFQHQSIKLPTPGDFPPDWYQSY
jgi:tagatose 1,6-diphosphate aldolase